MSAPKSLPSQIDRYIDLSLISSEDGFEVCSAYDFAGNEEVELALVPWHALSAVPTTVLRSSLEKLENLEHRSIVNVIDTGVDEKSALVYVATRSQSAPREAPATNTWGQYHQAIGKTVLEALAYAHSVGVTHGGLAANSVVFGVARRPRLRHLGIVELISCSSTLVAPAPRAQTPTFSKDLRDYVEIVVRALTSSGLDSDWQDSLQRSECPLEVVEVFHRAVTGDEELVNAEALAGVLEQVLGSPLRQRGPESAIALTLSPSASKAIEEKLPDEVSPPLDIVRRDLESTVHASFRTEWIENSPTLNTYEIYLYGKRLKYSTKVAEGHLVIVNAVPIDSNGDIQRGAAWECDQPMSLKSSSDGAKAKNLTNFTDSLSRFHLNTYKPISEALFLEWLKQLDTKRSLEEFREQPLPYSSFAQDGFIYTFQVAEDWDEDLTGQRRGARAEGASRKLVLGEVTNSTVGTVQMSLDNPAESPPPEGELVVDVGASTLALERQKRALQAVRFGNRSIARPDLHDLLLDPAASTHAKQIEPQRWFIENLDADKKAAIRGALATDDFFLVTGPPGTGKTQFIAELTAQVLAKKPTARILLTSQTHVALDNALERIRELLPEASLTRVGSRDGVKIAESVHDLLLPEQIRTWQIELRERGERNLVAMAEAAGADISALRTSARLSTLIGLADSIPRVEGALAALREEVDASGRVGDQQGVVLTTSQLTQNKVKQAGHKQKVKQLRNERDRLVAQVATSVGLPREDVLNLNGDELRQLRSSLIKATSDLEDWQEIIKLQDDWVQRLTSPREFEVPFLRERQVVAGTCIGLAALRNLEQIPFDLCIFDEASKATATESLVPMVRARRWVMVGDDRQLPPFQDEALFDPDFANDTPTELDREELRTTLFTRLCENLPKENQALLRTQYRMVPAIGNLISACFYDNELTTQERVRPAELKAAMPEPVRWLDTGAISGHNEFSAGAGKGYVNSVEQEQIVAWLSDLDSRLGVVGGDSGRKFQVLVTSSYRSQVFALRRVAAELQPSLDHLIVDVNTVDAVQGREVDVLVFSVTRSNSNGQWGFMKSDARINVALSRGRYGLVIVGDRKFALNAGASLGRVSRYLESQQKAGNGQI